MAFCSKCGKEIFDEAVICPHCGTQVKSLTVNISTTNNKSFVSALLLFFFFGYLGAHRFYLGHVGTGILIPILIVSIPFFLPLSLCNIPIVLIWLLVDLIRLCTGSLKAADGSQLVH